MQETSDLQRSGSQNGTGECSASDRIAAIQTVLRLKDVNGVIIPTADPHMSEYVAEHFALRKWLSGFTGSAGTLLISTHSAALITDSRYWVQAEQQLEGSSIELIRQTKNLNEHIAEWFKDALKGFNKPKVAVNPELVPYKNARELTSVLQNFGIALELKDLGLESLWTDRPPLAFNPILEHTISPRSRKEKFEEVGSALKEIIRKFLNDQKQKSFQNQSGSVQVQSASAAPQKRASASAELSLKERSLNGQPVPLTQLSEADTPCALLLSKLDDIAWIFNLRGSDIPCNPVFYSYALITPGAEKKAALFVDLSVLPADLKTRLESGGIEIKPYRDISAALSSLTDRFLIADPKEVNAALLSALHFSVCVVPSDNPVELIKALKTKEEIALIENAMVKDGVALVRFHAWLDEELKKGALLTEKSAADKLSEFRKQIPGFVSLSFETISAFGENAALPHYQPDPKKEVAVKGCGFLLIDSGVQLPEGTTDITRTVAIGEPSEEMKADYTAVLRGHIRLAMAVFPAGIPSQALDAIAREPLWRHFADFGHGTGHGVGFFLNVHEGPQRISVPRFSGESEVSISPRTALKAGMVTSNEPGIYRPGRWGIRIENLLAAVPAMENEFAEFLCFKTLTLCPIDLSAVITGELLADEVAWLNGYHRRVRETIAPHLTDAKAIEWLKERTAPI